MGDFSDSHKIFLEKWQVMNKKILIVYVVFVILILTTTVNAKVEIFVGVGEHYMENSEESLEQAKDKAKLAAELSAIEQAQINVQSYLEIHNSNLTRDEIISITAELLTLRKLNIF